MASYFWWDSKGFSGNGRPPNHQIRKCSDPKDTANKCDRKEFPSCNDKRKKYKHMIYEILYG